MSDAAESGAAAANRRRDIPNTVAVGEIRAVGILANAYRTAALEGARRLAQLLLARGTRVLCHSSVSDALGPYASGCLSPALAEVQVLVALGGDGTLLAASRMAAPHGIPVLGVHSGGEGSFGFLTQTTPADLDGAVSALLDGDYLLEERSMCSAAVSRSGEPVARFTALNDLVIRGQSRMLKLGVEVNGVYLATYAADGIILATPTGSTAYNLAAGGPLVHPSVEALILTPICPHTLNVRSLVVGLDEVVRVWLDNGVRDETLLTVDGQERFHLQPCDEVVFTRASTRARFIVFGSGGFYRRVHTRLRLGERFGVDSTGASTTQTSL